MSSSDPVFDRVTDPNAWKALPTPIPEARQALDCARGLTALARFVRDDQRRYQQGDQPRATPLDSAVASLLREIETWPLQISAAPPPTPEDPPVRAPWPSGYGEWYHTLREPVWQNLPVQRLWRGALQCTATAARLSAEQLAYLQGARAEPPTVPAALTTTKPLDVIHTALLTFPEAVRLAADAPGALASTTPSAVLAGPTANAQDPVPSPIVWQVGLIDRDHVVAWHTAADTDAVTWLAGSDGKAQVFVRPDQAIRAIHQAGGAVTLDASGAVAPVPDKIANVWRQYTVRETMAAMRALMGPEITPVAPATPAPIPTKAGPSWHWQAVNAHDAVLWSTVQQRGQDRVVFLPNPDHPQHAPWRVPLTTAQDPAAREAFTEAARISADPTVIPPTEMPSTVRQALKAWIERLQPQPTVPIRASAPSEAGSSPQVSAVVEDAAPPWELQQVQPGRWVCYRWGADGQPEWWHPPDSAVPTSASYWDDRRVAQWMATPDHANTLRHPDVNQVPLALAAGLSLGTPVLAVAGPHV